MAGNQSVVITGASGFIGQYLVKAFYKQNWTVYPVSRTNRAEIAGVQNVLVENYSDTPCPDNSVLIHLADVRSVTEADKLGEDRISGAEDTVRTLFEKPYIHKIFISSSAVYDTSLQTHVTPSSPVRKSNLYIRGKLACEEIALAKGGVVLRLANVIGAGMASFNVLSDILKQVPGKGPVQVQNSQVIRDFIDINDVVSGIIAIASSTGRGIYNLGSGRGISIGSLARMVLEISDEEAREIVSTKANQDSSSIILDISETKNKYGWQPAISVESSIKNIIGNKYD